MGDIADETMGRKGVSVLCSVAIAAALVPVEGLEAFAQESAAAGDAGQLEQPANQDVGLGDGGEAVVSEGTASAGEGDSAAASQVGDDVAVAAVGAVAVGAAASGVAAGGDSDSATGDAGGSGSDVDAGSDLDTDTSADPALTDEATGLTYKVNADDADTVTVTGTS